MIDKVSLLLATVTILIASGCATTTPSHPAKPVQTEIRPEIKAIALAPLVVPKEMADPESVRATFEPLIESKLREAGFLVVPSKECTEIWKRMIEQVGGFYDPVTGKRDEAKLKTVREHTFRELNARFNADAILFPSIRTVSVEWSSPTASWHGTSESIMQKKQALDSFMISMTMRSGTIPAYSLHVSIQDIHGAPLYANNGGIQLASKYTYGKETFVPVLRLELFADQERNKAAVNIALDPFMEKSGFPEGIKEERK